MVTAWWRRKKPQKKSRDAALWALRSGRMLTAFEISGETGMQWRICCAVLDYLLIQEVIEVEDGKYRMAAKIEEAISA